MRGFKKSNWLQWVCIPTSVCGVCARSCRTVQAPQRRRIHHRKKHCSTNQLLAFFSRCIYPSCNKWSVWSAARHSTEERLRGNSVLTIWYPRYMGDCDTAAPHQLRLLSASHAARCVWKRFLSGGKRGKLRDRSDSPGFSQPGIQYIPTTSTSPTLSLLHTRARTHTQTERTAFPFVSTGVPLEARLCLCPSQIYTFLTFSHPLQSHANCNTTFTKNRGLLWG